MSFESHLTEHGKGLQEGNLSEPHESSSHLDFVSLLSSVGEDILFPDELSCPEYEISSDLVEKRHIQSSDLPVILHPQQDASEVIGLICFIPTNKFIIHPPVRFLRNRSRIFYFNVFFFFWGGEGLKIYHGRLN